MQASALLLHCRSYHWACNLWVLIIYLFFLPVMLPSVLPRLATDSAVRVVPSVWKLQDRAPSLPLLSLFFFYFFPTSFQRQWAAFLGAWCPLPAFKSCFVEFTQRLNVLLMNLWGRKWFPCPILPHLGPPPAYWSLALFYTRRISSYTYSVALSIFCFPSHYFMHLYFVFCFLLD